MTAPVSTDRLLVEIGKRVRAARIAAGLSQQKAAAAAGSDFRWWQRLETGRINPTARTLAKVADTLGVTFWELCALRPAKVRSTK